MSSCFIESITEEREKEERRRNNGNEMLMLIWRLVLNLKFLKVVRFSPIRMDWLIRPK